MIHPTVDGILGDKSRVGGILNIHDSAQPRTSTIDIPTMESGFKHNLRWQFAGLGFKKLFRSQGRLTEFFAFEPSITASEHPQMLASW